MNNLKLRSYSFLFLSLQLDVVPHYQYFHSTHNTLITTEKFDSANHLINTHYCLTNKCHTLMAYLYLLTSKEDGNMLKCVRSVPLHLSLITENAQSMRIDISDIF